MNNTKICHTEDIDTLQEQLKILKKKKYDTKMRSQANIENIQKKSEYTLINIKNENLKNFKQELTHIIEKINQICTPSKKMTSNQNSIIKGIKLIQKSLLNTLRKIN